MSEYPIIVAPSILGGNPIDLVSSEALIAKAKAAWVHIDIMDGHFVSNLTFGPEMVAELRKDSQLYFDTHLMLDNPDAFVEPFAKAGSNNITIHVEPDYLIGETLQRIRDYGCSCGIALNPATSAEDLLPYLDKVDLILLMTVQPGYGGQAFKEEVLTKMQQVNQWRSEKGLNYRIEVDGGIDLGTGKRCYDNGVDTFVTGSSFFKAQDQPAYVQAFLDFK